jgi:hypothetical protein
LFEQDGKRRKVGHTSGSSVVAKVLVVQRGRGAYRV